jgi:RNA 2',3'-cyclic 3'-phosphodiesterase
VRLFVAIWPPLAVRERLGELDRPAVPGLRWTTGAQWHVTLAFLGEVPDGEQDALAGALAGVAGRLRNRPEAIMGPATEAVGRGIVCVPVGGLDAVAAAVRTSPLGRYISPGEARFSGHLTLARARRGRRVPDELCGMPVDARWSVDELCLVSSRLDPEGARYETVTSATIRS